MFAHDRPGPGPTFARAGRKAVFGLALVLVLSFQACSLLPTLVPDLARRPLPPVPLVGAHGPLTAARSKAVLAALHERGTPTDIFERHLALEQAIVGSPLTTGNRVRLLKDGDDTFRAMLVAIESATDHINLETYILDDDAVGQRFASALIARQQAGVQVNLIRDSAGTLRTPAAYFERLQASGIRVLEFNPLNPLQARKAWELNRRDHRKLLIVDGRTAILGGINISSVHSGGSARSGLRDPLSGRTPWRDTDLQISGPAVAELQQCFLEAWASQKGQPLAPRDYFPPLEAAGTMVVRIIASSPDEPYSLMYATLLSAIGAAETSVQLTNAYFVPDPQLLAALVDAAARGVAVTLILPGETDSWLTFHAGRASYELLLRSGVTILERQGAILHSKTALIDDVWATVGSTNLDWRSFLHNHELDAVVLGPDFGHQLRALFEADRALSRVISLQDWERRGPLLRLQESLARLWQYWL